MDRVWDTLRNEFGSDFSSIYVDDTACAFNLRSGGRPEQPLFEQLHRLICKASGSGGEGYSLRVTRDDGTEQTVPFASSGTGGKSPSSLQDLIRGVASQLGKKDSGSSSASSSQSVGDTVEEVLTGRNASSSERPPMEDKTSEEPSSPPPAEPEGPTALERADSLVGCAAFRNLCHEIAERAPHVLQNGTQEFFFREGYLFAADSGSGFGTASEILSDLLSECGLFSDAKTPRSFELPSPRDSEAAQKLANLAGTLEDVLTSQRVVTLDISAWIGAADRKDFKQLLMNVFVHNRSCVVLFRMPYVGAETLHEMAQDLSDIMTVRPVPFEPFSDEELQTLACRFLAPFNITFSDDAREVFNRRIREEKRDGYFYGVHTVQKIVGELVRQLETSGAASRVITAELAQSDSALPEEEEGIGFDDMIAMDNVKAQLDEILAQIQYAAATGMGQKPCMHMCFVGNPGTGKTTVARILGAELKKRGILRIGKFYEHRGRDLCGEYVGHTAPKTTAICQQAYGSVLFIDEAYSLYSEDNSRDYGHEAIDTLIAEMENHYNDLVVILAGYPDDMQHLLSMNPGLRSRVPYTLHFPSYNPDQLHQIFMKMASGKFELAPGFEERAAEFFHSLPQRMIDEKAFGNARFVRNVYERVWSKAVTRSSAAGLASVMLTAEDFDAAAAEFALPEEKKTVRIGF